MAAQTPDAHIALPLEIDAENNRASSWHTDVTFVPAFPQFSVLRGVVIPPVGGDTVWANVVAAYATLPPVLRGLAEQLWALHSNVYDYGATRPNATAKQVQRYETVFKSTIYETEHPVVQVHPLTGERAIILGYFARKLLNVSSADSGHLFAMLQDHVTRLENTVRWRWQAGDVVIWDNRASRDDRRAGVGRHRWPTWPKTQQRCSGSCSGLKRNRLEVLLLRVRETACGPTLPSSAPARGGSYLGRSCRHWGRRAMAGSDHLEP